MDSDESENEGGARNSIKRPAASGGESKKKKVEDPTRRAKEDNPAQKCCRADCQGTNCCFVVEGGGDSHGIHSRGPTLCAHRAVRIV